MPKCFVIQPFDNGGPFDRRYDEVIEPSIKAADLEAYRVDRDPTVEIPIEEIEAGIKSALVCLADISTNNPNVWYEVGFARAQGKGLVMTCSEERLERFPFDIQHRAIIRYGTESPSAFQKMSSEITARLKALATKQVAIEALRVDEVTEGSTSIPDPLVAALGIIVGYCPLPGDTVTGARVIDDMEHAGYTKAMSGLSIRSLIKRAFLKTVEERDYHGNDYTALQLTNLGESWLLDNEARIKLRIDSLPTSERPRSIGDLPF